MTLTELRYIVALARERHFGHAAEASFVSQPILSVAVKKLEDELGVALFERGKSEVATTPVGERVVEQARRVLEELEAVKRIAREARDPRATSNASRSLAASRRPQTRRKMLPAGSIAERYRFHRDIQLDAAPLPPYPEGWTGIRHRLTPINAGPAEVASIALLAGAAILVADGTP